MGRKMGMKGRPGLLFIGILIIFLVVFYLTWKSMITPSRKTEVKDIYSMNYQSARHVNLEQRPHSDLNDIWHRAKLLHGDEDKGEKDGDDSFDLHPENSKRNHIFPNQREHGIQSPLSNLLHASHQPLTKIVMKEPYYKKPDETLKIIGGRLERFVHLDLKGAAPKMSYLKEIFPLFSRLGATGLLIEYEDMFPYSGKLQTISANNSYSSEQIKEILSLAKLNSLQVIPLIQTFGHMEFVLKALHMESYRESKHTPQVINVASNASYELLHELVSQILAAHPDVSYLHIGCDEVYELGRGRSADILIREKVTTEALFLRHVKRVADIVTRTSQKKVRPIIWDDELRKLPEAEILAAGLPSSVDIMVWRYTQNISDKLTETVWKKYGRLFKTVWVASSFKGATGSRQLYTEPQHHIINHFSWVDAISKYSQYVSFKGVALTGWQRYDHFATLCELMPVALPSLAVCLATIRNGGFDEDIHKTTSSLLGCSGMLEMGFPKLDEEERKAIVSQDCRFPGHMIYYAVQQLWGIKQFQEESRRSGWLSDYQISHSFSNPGQLNVLAMRMASLQSNLIQVKTPLQENLLQVYSHDTVEEWLDENIFEMRRQIKVIQGKIQGLTKEIHWARRPLPAVTNPPPVAKALVTKPPATQRPETGYALRKIPGSGVGVGIGSNAHPALGQNEGNLNLLKLKRENQNQILGERSGITKAPVTKPPQRPETDYAHRKTPGSGMGVGIGSNAHPALGQNGGNLDLLKPKRENQNWILGERSGVRVQQGQHLLQRQDDPQYASRIKSNRARTAPTPILTDTDMSQQRLGMSEHLKKNIDLLDKSKMAELSRQAGTQVRFQDGNIHKSDMLLAGQRHAPLNMGIPVDRDRSIDYNSQSLDLLKKGGPGVQNKDSENHLLQERDFKRGVTFKPKLIDVNDKLQKRTDPGHDNDLGIDTLNPASMVIKSKENEGILARMLADVEGDNMHRSHHNLINGMNSGAKADERSFAQRLNRDDDGDF